MKEYVLTPEGIRFEDGVEYALRELLAVSLTARHPDLEAIHNIKKHFEGTILVDGDPSNARFLKRTAVMKPTYFTRPSKALEPPPKPLVKGYPYGVQEEVDFGPGFEKIPKKRKRKAAEE